MPIVKQFLLRKNVMKIITVTALLCNLTLRGEAVPPSAIELSYDKEKQALHIIIKHVSDNTHKHYIRRIEVTRNAEPPFPYFFTSQTSASEQIADIPMKAAPHDTIHVLAICSRAGRGEQVLVIPEE